MKLLLLFLFLELSLFASIGKISALNGKVVVDRQKQLLDASVGFDLEEKDLVLTDDKSKAQITLNDGTVLSLGKSSKLDINEYVFDEKDSSNSKAEFKFVEGTFKSITGAIGKVAPEKFKLETKSASIGIRGTIVVGNQEKVACTQGRITVTSAGVTQVLGAGMMTNTEIGKAPTPPTKIEGNLLKEVELNSGTKKEESKSTTSESKEKTSEEKTSQNNKSNESATTEQSTTKTEQTAPSQPVEQNSNNQAPTLSQNLNNTSVVSNVSSLTEITSTVNTTITQTSSNKIQEDIAEAQKKAEAIDAATILSNQANATFSSINTASTNVTTASTNVTTMTQDVSLNQETQLAIGTLNSASTSANTLSNEAQKLKDDIATLLVQAQSANISASDAVSKYEQIKIKLNLLNSKLTDVTSLVSTAQNSLKTVSVNLSSVLSNQANATFSSINTASTNVTTASTNATTMTQGVSVNQETQLAIGTLNSASTSASTLSNEAQKLKDDIATLLVQAQSANISASDAVSKYEQIKIKLNLLNSKLTDVTSLVSTAQNSLKTVSVNLANSLSSQANTTLSSINTASTNVTTASTNVTTMTQDVSLNQETQLAIGTLNSASTSANTLSNEAQKLKDDIATLLVQAQSANISASDAVSKYEQIKIKLNLLNSKLTDVTSLVSTAQNSLKTVSVNLSSILSTEASAIVNNIATTAGGTQSSVNTASQMVENASSSAMNEAITAANLVNNSASRANELSIEAQALKTEISLLLEQAQSANISASDALSKYEQIKAKSILLNSKLTEVTNTAAIALNNSKAVVNTSVYSTSINLSSSGVGSVGSKTFTVGSGGSNVTIATYGSSDGSQSLNSGNSAAGFDPVLILLKLNSSTSSYETTVIGKNDDSWIVADNYYNSILNLDLTEGTYTIFVADYLFDSSEALSGINTGTNDASTVKLYFTSTNNLTFDSTGSTVEKYSYITKYNNKAYINDLSFTKAKTENSNAKFGILADSKVGTAIKIDDYGYFVTISDYFGEEKNAFLNTSEIDDGSSWGYWSKTIYTDTSGSKNSIDMKSTWISGNQVTPPSNYKATFNGQVIGSVSSGSNTGYIKLDEYNKFKATIDIGAATITDSLIQFKESLSNNLWSGTFNTSGTVNVNQQGFSSSIVNNSNNISGSLSGTYFGTTNSTTGVSTVQSIGGTFNMTNGGATANGVFKAR